MTRPNLPLAAAAERLRKRPGRPRKVGHTPGTPAPEGPATGEPEGGAPARPAVAPRLLDVDGAAAYLSLSPWTVRDLINNGTLPRVRVPLPNRGELRKVLLDREDLDRLVEIWKEPM